MTYSPYTSSGGCKDAGAVTADIELIASKGFTSIRLYSTECHGLENVGSAASKHGMKLVLGVFIRETGVDGAKPQINDIISWAKSCNGFSMTEMIVVGNEAVFNGHCSARELAAFISSARSQFQAAGFSGAVTTTEPINIWKENAAALCPAMDGTIGANIHAFFNSKVTASEAGSFVSREIESLPGLCPGKQLVAYNLETGWPHSGSANGAAIPGKAEQEEAVMGILQHAGSKSVMFSFVDDLWKHGGKFGVEQSFGCSQLFGH